MIHREDFVSEFSKSEGNKKLRLKVWVNIEKELNLDVSHKDIKIKYNQLLGIYKKFLEEFNRSGSELLHGNIGTCSTILSQKKTNKTMETEIIKEWETGKGSFFRLWMNQLMN